MNSKQIPSDFHLASLVTKHHTVSRKNSSMLITTKKNLDIPLLWNTVSKTKKVIYMKLWTDLYSSSKCDEELRTNRNLHTYIAKKKNLSRNLFYYKSNRVRHYQSSVTQFFQRKFLLSQKKLLCSGGRRFQLGKFHLLPVFQFSTYLFSNFKSTCTFKHVCKTCTLGLTLQRSVI